MSGIAMSGGFQMAVTATWWQTAWLQLCFLRGIKQKGPIIGERTGCVMWACVVRGGNDERIDGWKFPASLWKMFPGRLGSVCEGLLFFSHLQYNPLVFWPLAVRCNRDCVSNHQVVYWGSGGKDYCSWSACILRSKVFFSVALTHHLQFPVSHSGLSFAVISSIKNTPKMKNVSLGPGHKKS